jgi:hypothetical protein
MYYKPPYFTPIPPSNHGEARPRTPFYTRDGGADKPRPGRVAARGYFSSGSLRLRVRPVLRALLGV